MDANLSSLCGSGSTSSLSLRLPNQGICARHRRAGALLKLSLCNGSPTGAAQDYRVKSSAAIRPYRHRNIKPEFRCLIDLH